MIIVPQFIGEKIMSQSLRPFRCPSLLLAGAFLFAAVSAPCQDSKAPEPGAPVPAGKKDSPMDKLRAKLDSDLKTEQDEKTPVKGKMDSHLNLANFSLENSNLKLTQELGLGDDKNPLAGKIPPKYLPAGDARGLYAVSYIQWYFDVFWPQYQKSGKARPEAGGSASLGEAAYIQRTAAAFVQLVEDHASAVVYTGPTMSWYVKAYGVKSQTKDQTLQDLMTPIPAFKEVKEKVDAERAAAAKQMAERKDKFVKRWGQALYDELSTASDPAQRERRYIYFSSLEYSDNFDLVCKESYFADCNDLVNKAPAEFRGLKAPKSSLFIAWLDETLGAKAKRIEGNKYSVELPLGIRYIELAEFVHENKCVKIRDDGWQVWQNYMREDWDIGLSLRNWHLYAAGKSHDAVMIMQWSQMITRYFNRKMDCDPGK